MHFLPHFPLHINTIILFGLTLLLGLIGGELAQRFRMPRISGYIIVGFLVGPSALNLVTPTLLVNARIFVDISLGLILFDLGRHLDFTWLFHDRGIILMSLAESSLTFLFIMMMLFLFHFPWLQAVFIATIAIATSPAVIMLVASDLDAKGPVTRRTYILTSLNNLYALIIFMLILPLTQTTVLSFIFHSAVYRLFGSLLLGLLIFGLTLIIAYFVGKQKENQFVLFVGSVMLAIGLSTVLHFSSMLTLFIFGVAARNANVNNLLIEINFGWLAKLFFILLFVVIGVHLELNGLWQATWIVLAFILLRSLAKSCGIWLFSKYSRLTPQQASSLCFALTPMAGVAVGMSNIISDFNPALGYQLMTIMATVVAILNLIGPIVTQLAFINADEVVVKSN